MASARYEELEGQTKEAGGVRRSQSTLGRLPSRKGRSEGNLIETFSLDQQAIGDGVGRDVPAFETSAASKALLETLSREQEGSQAQLKKHYLSRLVLRPVDHPEKGDLTKDGSRSSTQSTPNSYMLNSGARLDIDPVAVDCELCRATSSSIDTEHEKLLKSLPTTAITDAQSDTIPLLSSVRSIHGSHTGGSEIEIHAIGTMSDVRSRSSSVSTKSRGINYHALLKRSPSASDIGLPLPPVLSQTPAHYRCSSRTLSLDKAASRPKRAIMGDDAFDSPFQGPGSRHRTHASFDSRRTSTDALRKTPTGGPARNGAGDGDLSEIKTMSDYGHGRQVAEEESVVLNGASKHAAISYEKLIGRPTLREDSSTAALTAPLETGSRETKSGTSGAKNYASLLGTPPNTLVMANSLVQSPVSLPSSFNGTDKHEFPTRSKGLDPDWPTPARGQTEASRSGTRRTFRSLSSSGRSYTDSDASSTITVEESGPLQSPPRPTRWPSNRDFQSSSVNKNRRYTSPDAVEPTGTAKASNYRRPYSQGASRRASAEPGYAAGSEAETGARSPTQWIRQLLRRRTTGSKPDSPPHLTARPPRRPLPVPTPVAPKATGDPLPAAWNSPSFEDINIGSDIGEPSETGTQFQRETNDSFNKMIQELEAMLNEALHIAKEASEKQITQQLLQEATTQLHHQTTSGVSGNQTSPTAIPRNPITLGPINIGSKKSAMSLIPKRSRKQSGITENSPRLLGNKITSNASPRMTGSIALSSTGRRGIEIETQQPDAFDRILIIEPPPPEHTPSNRKPAAEHLLTPYPNASAVTSAVTSQASLPYTEVKPSISREYQSMPEPVGMSQQGGGHTVVSSPIEQLPATQQEPPQGLQRRETDALSDDSYQRTPPRFYEGDEELDPHQGEEKDIVPGGTSSGIYNTPRRPHVTQSPVKERVNLVVRDNRPPPNLPSRDDVRRHIKQYNSPPIQPRHSSSGLRQFAVPKGDGAASHGTIDFAPRKRKGTSKHASGGHRPFSSHDRHPPHASDAPNTGAHRGEGKGGREHGLTRRFSLSNRRHISLRGAHHFSLRRSHRRQPISRDWSTAKKRFTAAVACISTALVGVIVGVYTSLTTAGPGPPPAPNIKAGEVPAIQYQITDLNHYAILGNVFFYIGLAIPTLVFWPLPLLHGRKPYTLVALALLMPLQFPQGQVVSATRSPYIAWYRVTLLLCRGVSGFALGFANINFKATLLDLFGSSLQSGNPHQERVIANDVRRHGGGMGMWLSIWSWCFIGSIGVGFFVGALIINKESPAWGFWLVMVLVAAVLLLNVLTPEVRRSAYRRSVAEVLKGTEVSRRVARGEIKMHISSTGPKWWWEEVHAGLTLCWRMMRQPGFTVIALYSSWIYGQIVMVIVLLGALTSKYYRFLSPYVGLCVTAVSVGALLAIPFQKASLFSRARHHPQRTDSDTFEKRVTWSSHLVRRAFFMLALPFADIAYTLSSGGTQTHFMVPTVLAGLIGFLSILAISECNGIVMETFDTSDLQQIRTMGIKRPSSDAEKAVLRRTNYSCYPRVSSAFAVMHTMGFLAAAIATGIGGRVERRIGAQAATGCVAGVLLVLTLALWAVLWRWKEVQVVPDLKHMERDLMENEEEPWEPVIIGNPSGRMRRMNVLELGGLSRWSEIRRLNKILEQSGIGMSRWREVRRSLRKEMR
ncbi:hypothetical protein GP486_006409 [Trichoglossum hirsutum]|uniref:Uncharacterized protein n=1 Tax=Trichoglossum hirsutum TaxID=265104 RepID=A0A9P8L7T6_9PEZI|nr:hypothetical protein GP486_006409 [Trichoglossum hirsutum]